MKLTLFTVATAILLLGMSSIVPVRLAATQTEGCSCGSICGASSNTCSCFDHGGCCNCQCSGENPVCKCGTGCDAE